MLTRPVVRAVMLAAAVLTAAGCGSQAAAPPGGLGPASPSPASQSASPGHSASPAPGATITPGGPMITPSPGGGCASQPVPGPGGIITLRDSSNGGTFCVPVGQHVLVELDSKPSQMWSPIRSDARALTPLASGRFMLRAGETAALFAAAHPGIAHLSSARAVCGGGPLHCDALMAFQVTIMVGGIQGSPVH